MSQETIRFRDHDIPTKVEREFRVDEIGIIDEENGIAEFSLTSEEPYQRWYAIETLIHTKDSVVLDRVENGSAHLLENHNPDYFIGNILKAWVDENTKKLRVRSKFELDNPYDDRGKKIWHRVKSGTLKTVSGGYRYLEYEEKKINDDWHLIVTKWELLEGSITPVPADFTVGQGRNLEDSKPNQFNWEELNQKIASVETTVNNFISEVKNMGDENTTTTLEVSEPDFTQERERSAAIFAAGQEFNCPELAQKALNEGWSITQLRSEILAQQANQKPVARTTDPLGMSEKEKKQYSMTRAVEAALNRNFDNAGFEKEIHQELVKKAQEDYGYQERQTVLIPVYDLSVNQRQADEAYSQMARSAAYRNVLNYFHSRNQQVGDPELGGNLIETELLAERFIDIFRNKSILRRMGMQSLTGLMGNIDIPKQISGAVDGNSVFWVPEDGDVGKIEARFGLVKLRPKNVGSYMYMTRSMLLHSSIGMNNFTRRELAIALALGIDWAGIAGKGIDDQPLGVLNTDGTNSIIFDGDAPDWARIVQFETKIATANADERTMSWAINSRMRGELKSRTKFENTSNETLWQNAMAGSNQGYINGYRAEVSNQIPGNLTKGTATDLNAMVFGDWSRLVCGEWGTYELAADPFDRFLSGGIRVRILHTCDFAVTQPKAFSVASDVSTPLSDAA